MQLLGPYVGNFAAFQYQQLLALLQAAIATGDLGSGSAFDKTTLLQLEAQATSFANLPLATAGMRAQDESLLQPIGLLQARFTALLAEANNFVTRSATLIDYIQAETDLLDQLLAADLLANWVADLPRLPSSWSTAWDFSIDSGKLSLLIPPVDPSNGVQYTNQMATATLLDTSSGDLTAGLLPPIQSTAIPVKDLSWSFTADGVSDLLYSEDMTWTELNLVQPLPEVLFTAEPQTKILLPLVGATPNIIALTGQVPGGVIPIYLRLLFYPRVRQVSGLAFPGTVFPLSSYTIDPDNVIVYQVKQGGTTGLFYKFGPDFSIDQTGSITPITIPAGTEIVVRFVENYPAYQCSVDNLSWSDIHMLDTARPYRDDETSFLPLGIVNNTFPLTDETGLVSGIYFTLNGVLDTDYTILVTTPAAQAVGTNCVLKVDLQGLSYLNTLHLKPFSEFPAHLTTVQISGLAGQNLATVFVGDLLVDRDLEIRFPRQIVSSVYLTFVQQSYTIIEYAPLSTSALRRATMATVEASLPFSLGQYIPPVSETLRGYEYSLGFELIEGRDVAYTGAGVLVQGPFVVTGYPKILRLDLEYTGACQAYVCYQAFSATGVLVDENVTGFAVTSGTSFVMPYTSGTTVSNIASVQLSLKFALRSADAVLSRYNLQAVL